MTESIITKDLECGKTGLDEISDADLLRPREAQQDAADVALFGCTGVTDCLPMTEVMPVALVKWF